MPTVLPIAIQPNASHDAPRTERTTRDEIAAPKRTTVAHEPLDASAEDPYDNVACTD